MADGSLLSDEQELSLLSQPTGCKVASMYTWLGQRLQDWREDGQEGGF